MHTRHFPLCSVAAVAAAALLFAACGDDSDSDGSDSTTTTVPISAVVTTVVPATTGPAATTTGPAATTTSAPTDALDNTSWVLDTTALGVEGGEAVTSTMIFDDGKVLGSNGCNQFGSTYVITGEGTLEFGEFAQTAIGCEGAAVAVEQAVNGRVAAVTGFAVTPESLALTDVAGATVLSYVPAPTGVAGVWDANGYLKADGSAFTSLVTDTRLTANFGEGVVSGSAGCNDYSGSFVVIGDTIKIGPLASTKKLCTEPEGVTDQELDFLAALQSSTSFTNDGAALTLLNDQDQRTVTFDNAA